MAGIAACAAALATCAPCWGEPAAAPPFSSLPAVVSVRHWSQPGVTRVAVELTGKVKWRSERIDNPARVFLDLDQSRIALGSKGVHTVPVEDALLKQVRLAYTRPRVTRIVLDLAKAGIEYAVSELTSPDRLMIELRDAGAEMESSSAARKPPETTPATELPRAPVVLHTPSPAVEKPAPAVKPSTPEPVPPAVARRAETAEATAAATEGKALAAPPKPARATTTDGRRSLTRALGLKLGRIVIDPGHGGQDQGTKGLTGLLEKDLALDVGQRLAALIEQQMGSTVILTRTTDVFIPLEERTEIANRHRADLFISIHANSSPLRSASGAEVFFLNFTTSKEALETAARENAGHGKSIFELQDLIEKIALKDKVDESRDFAAKVQKSLYATWARMNSRTRNRGVKQAPFVVLIGASMPSILAEIGFLSNPRDESLLKRPDQRQRIAEALYRGISQYADSLSQLNVARAGTAQEN